MSKRTKVFERLMAPKRARTTKTHEATLKTLPAEFKELDEFGIQIIPSILDDVFCDDVIRRVNNIFMDFGQENGRYIRFPSKDDPDGWRQYWKHGNLPFNSHGIFQHGIGHYQPLWDVRQHPEVVDTFARIWSTKPEDMITSFDGMSLAEPLPVFRKGKDWRHFDQGNHLEERGCIQGMVNLEPMESHDFTFFCAPGSHKYHAEFMEHFNIDTKGKNWYKPTPEQRKWLLEKPGVTELRVSAPRGSLVLWDSRTFHSNAAPDFSDPSKTHHWRYNTYVCQTPRRLATPAVLKRKQKHFNEKRTTNHWPHRPNAFGLEPQKWGAEKAPATIPMPERLPRLTKLGRRLAGF